MDCIPTMIGWLYPVWHNICVSLCLLNVVVMLAIKLKTHVGKSARRFWRERLYIVGLQSSFLQLLCLQLFKTDMARFFFLVPLCVNDFPWEIFGMDFVTYLT